MPVALLVGLLSGSSRPERLIASQYYAALVCGLRAALGCGL